MIQERNRLLGTEKKLVVARGEVCRCLGKVEEMGWQVKNYSYAIVSDAHEIYSIGNIVNNIMITVVIDGNQTYFVMCRNSKSLHCALGTNIK